MAKKPAQGEGQAASKVRASVMASRLSLVLLAVLVGVIFLPTVVFLFFALLPTWVAMIIGRGNRYSWICVGGLNLSGAASYLLTLWFETHTLDHAVSIITDVFALIVIYGAAGFGWLLYNAMPPVVAVFMDMTAQHRVTYLRTFQRRLITMWGQELIKAANERLGSEAGSDQKKAAQ